MLGNAKVATRGGDFADGSSHPAILCVSIRNRKINRPA
jgi:hypothetical protein